MTRSTPAARKTSRRSATSFDRADEPRVVWMGEHLVGIAAVTLELQDATDPVARLGAILADRALRHQRETAVSPGHGRRPTQASSSL